MLTSFGLYSFFTPEHVLAATPVTHTFWLLLPNGVWQLGMALAGLWQLYALATDSRWKRGTAAFVAAVFYVWATENQIVFAHGFKALFLFIAGWVGVNLYAVVRSIRGQL